jgi:hypothetical protein
MSNMKNYMMDIEEFCNGYFNGDEIDFTVDEVVEDVGFWFNDTMAKKYARQYITKQLAFR